MLQNAYFLAKIGADTAENEQHFAEDLPETSQPAHLPVGVGSEVDLGERIRQEDDKALSAYVRHLAVHLPVSAAPVPVYRYTPHGIPVR